MAAGNTFSGGTFVGSGTLIVASPLGLPAGSSLFVGANAASLLAGLAQNAAPIPGRPGASGESSGGGTASPPSAAAFRELDAATGAALQAIEDVIDPTDKVHSQAIVCQACGVDLQVLNAAKADGATLTGVSSDVVDAALLQALNITAPPNGSPAGDVSFISSGNADVDAFLWLDDTIVQFLQYLQSNDGTSGS